MLPKRNRADKKAIEKIFREGKFLNSPNLTFKFLKTTSNSPSRISFIAPRTVAKGAVERNKLRRIGYRALNGHVSELPRGIVGAFVFRKREEDVSIILNEIKSVFSKIN